MAQVLQLLDQLRDVLIFWKGAREEDFCVTPSASLEDAARVLWKLR
jgi:hypothetical protein